MYTSLNAGRQSWLTPFIQAQYESLQFHTYFHLHAPGIQTYVQCVQMDRQCQLSPLSCALCTIVSFIIQPVNVCKVLVHVQTQTFACNLSLTHSFSLHLICLQYSWCWWTEVTLVYQVSFMKFRKTSEPPHCHTTYNNKMKRTIKDNNEHWLSENRLSPRKLGKGLLLKGWQPDKAIHCYCWLVTEVARRG